MAQTSRLIGPLIDFFFPNMSEAGRLTTHYYVRKTAHFTEYFILAVITVRTLIQTGLSRRPRLVVLIPMVTVIVVAFLDEFNQSFEISRTGSVWDALLDTAGGFCGTVASILYLRRRQRPEISSS